MNIFEEEQIDDVTPKKEKKAKTFDLFDSSFWNEMSTPDFGDGKGFWEKEQNFDW